MLKLNRGFTIVEVATVIVVIAILVSITSLAYGNYRNRVADTAVQSNLQAFATATEAFVQKNNRYPSSAEELKKFGIDVTPSAYPSTGIVLTYCSNYSSYINPTTGQVTFKLAYGFVGRSASGSIYIVTDKTGPSHPEKVDKAIADTWNGSGAGLWCAARAGLSRWDTTSYPYYEVSVGKTYTTSGDWAGITK